MENSRKLDLRNILLFSAAVVLVMFAVSTYVWTQVPAGQAVCTHWNAAGECDDYGSKFVGIYLMPIVTTGIVGLLVLIPRIEPRATNIAKSATAYTAVWAVILLFFLGFHTILMLELLGRETSVGTYTPFLVGLLFVVIGNYMGKVRSNFMFGIRTPWTLTSDLSWNKTHRLGGKLFVLLGILYMASTIFPSRDFWVYLLMGGTLGMVVLLFAYSYFIWRGDPDAQVL